MVVRAWRYAVRCDVCEVARNYSKIYCAHDIMPKKRDPALARFQEAFFDAVHNGRCSHQRRKVLLLGLETQYHLESRRRDVFHAMYSTNSFHTFMGGWGLGSHMNILIARTTNIINICMTLFTKLSTAEGKMLILSHS